MREPWMVMSLLEADNSRLAKESIINEEAIESNDVFFTGCKLALDSTVTFGIKQVGEKSDETGPGLAWDDFFNTVSTFIDRSCTGNAARDAVNELMNTATKEQWNNWYRRILIKDLRCGVSDKTINKAVKKYNKYLIPVFSCQLAHDSANHETKVTGKKLIEVKLDGCLSEEWIVEFENGQQLSIKEVVDNKLKGKIKSYNTITGKIEFNEILNWAVDGEDANEDFYEWFEIELENGMILPPLTGNHLVYLPKLKCYRRADLLEEGDEVLIDI
jgi:hypothetical protein